jgi:hypothetical protein
MSDVSIEMPRYKCHKEVHALKIEDIVFDHEKRGPNEETDGSATITPAEERYAPFKVDSTFVRKHLMGLQKNQIIGGYYVVYADGYKSFSPAAAFEEGYTKIGE